MSKMALGSGATVPIPTLSCAAARSPKMVKSNGHKNAKCILFKAFINIHVRVKIGNTVVNKIPLSAEWL
jgi:hypothetical protein